MTTIPHLLLLRLGACGIALSVAVTVLGIGVLPSVARAAHIRAAPPPILQGNGSCGASSGYPIIGTVDFTRGGNTVTLDVTFKGAPPGDTYTVHLLNVSSSVCSDLIPGGLGTIATNGKGVGHGSFAATVPAGDTSFIADPVGSSGSSRTPEVTLP